MFKKSEKYKSMTMDELVIKDKELMRKYTAAIENNDDLAELQSELKTLQYYMDMKSHVLTFEAENCNDEAWDIVISVLKEKLPHFSVWYGDGDWMTFKFSKE